GEDVPHADTDPFGIAHGAVAPLAPQHARREAAAAVARALIDGDDLRSRELRPELVQRELEGTIHATVHLEPPRGHVYAGGYREDVIAHEERVVRRDGTVEVLHGRFELRGSRGQQDEIGLLRIADEWPRRQDRVVRGMGG